MIKRNVEQYFKCDSKMSTFSKKFLSQGKIFLMIKIAIQAEYWKLSEK